ncbi:U2 small nuclear ribonucleoprotein A' [Oryzias melastigma]|uniref:U2 small nuclear ribonucleoprotein A n=1 Tax=Oryzias melastigma TaxID=30732 RepID=A0A834L0X1_ORYME|nr:U2 small nuclear ribonucleoprotein A' [Oryzias melastigma]
MKCDQDASLGHLQVQVQVSPAGPVSPAGLVPQVRSLLQVRVSPAGLVSPAGPVASAVRSLLQVWSLRFRSLLQVRSSPAGPVSLIRGDLDPLASVKTLTLLSLLRNPVTNKKHYRLYVISKLPHIRVLDFQKVKMKERQEAEKLFKGKRGAQLAKDIAKRTKTFIPGVAQQQEKKRSGPSQAEVEAIKHAISNASSLAEVERLKGMLQAGQIPGREDRQGLPEVEEEEDEEEITEAVEAQMEEGYEENDQEEKELEDAPHENGS